ncbi:MAG TPA: hypothetical protein VJN94_00695 [Candidatus Binataceae bacterium]|nr:hypothetical protein [Candidatus Binataceae bacterium]
MDHRPLKRIDILRHELKALRFILDNYHSGNLDAGFVPPRDDFQSEQGREIYDAIMNASERAAAERRIATLELDEVDIESFLRLTGEHYHTYPALVHERAEAIRSGQLKVEAA